MKPLTLIFLCTFLCGFMPLGMVEYRADYEKIVAAYKSHPSMSFNVSYKSFDQSKTKADTVITGRYQLKGDKFKTRILGTEAVKNDKYYLAIDHGSKMIFVYRASAFTGNFYPTSTIDTLVKKKAISVSGEELNGGKSRRYDISNNSKVADSYLKVSYEFDRNSYLIKKVVMHLPARENVYKQQNWTYLSDPFVEFNYNDYNFSDIEESTFSTEKYVSIKDDGLKIEPREAYKSYRVVNSILISQQIR